MKLPTRNEARQAIQDGKGEGVVIAILDSGIEEKHPHFDECCFLKGYEVVAMDGKVDALESESIDEVGHGTAVAGIIHSMAPRARLMSVKVLAGGMRRQHHEAVRLGVQKALSEGAIVLNCSFGVPGASYSLPGYKSWTDEAFRNDCHVVSASSNTSAELPEWPGHLLTTHSVTAADFEEDVWEYRSGHQVAFGAKGVDVKVPCPGGGYASLTGSSFAAAHFSGLVARLLSVFPKMSPSLVRDIFRSLAK